MRTSVRSLMLVTVVFAICGLSQAQLFTTLHGFSYYGDDGGYPRGGLTQDAAGNLYGVTYTGGILQCFDSLSQRQGCGVVFKLSRHGAGWVFTSLYEFGGQPDGGMPFARVIVGPDGALYGTTSQGGTGSCLGYHGCGTVFKLQPPANFCGGVSCPWRETILYNFSSRDDGFYPAPELAFDRAGNLYGSTAYGGGSLNCPNDGCGTLFELTPNNNGTWTKTTIHTFQGGADGEYPAFGVVVDQAGNLYGTGSGGYASCECGDVFEFSPGGSGWTETVLYSFTNGTDGEAPGQLIFDSSGNLWGPSEPGGVFELMPLQGGGWQFSVQYTFNFYQQLGYPNALTMDAAGNIYGTAADGGYEGFGTLYKLAPSDSGLIYTTLYSFGYDNGNQGFNPTGKAALDAAGNIYGENGIAAEPPFGAVWEFQP